MPFGKNTTKPSFFNLINNLFILIAAKVRILNK